MSRPPVAVIAWTTVSGRAAEIAASLGGESRCWYWSWPAPIRYLAASVLTVAYLVRRRPRGIIVTNPPVFPGLIAWVYSRFARAPVVIDAHPGSFGLKEDRIGRLMLPVTRWLAGRVSSHLVTAEELAAEVRSWEGDAEILHEAPPLWSVPAEPPARDPMRVLFVSRFASDEPAVEVVEAARDVPEIEVVITGDPDRAPDGLIARAPANVRFIGFVDPEEYAQRVAESDVLLALTTEPTSVMRAAYEAIYANRPLIVSDWPLLRELFPFAIHVRNETSAIAEGLRRAATERNELRAAAGEARRLQEVRWDAQLGRLQEALQ
jgi:glycosyltransferase involved in cell wall biosynthesis